MGQGGRYRYHTRRYRRPNGSWYWGNQGRYCSDSFPWAWKWPIRCDRDWAAQWERFQFTRRSVQWWRWGGFVAVKGGRWRRFCHNWGWWGLGCFAGSTWHHWHWHSGWRFWFYRMWHGG